MSMCIAKCNEPNLHLQVVLCAWDVALIQPLTFWQEGKHVVHAMRGRVALHNRQITQPGNIP